MLFEKMAKPLYWPEGQNSWHHICQVHAHAVDLIGRELTTVEAAAAVFHDCAVKAMTAQSWTKAGHGVWSSRLAGLILSHTGLFSAEELEGIKSAVAEHDSDENPSHVSSSELSDLLQSADFNRPDPAWILHKSYCWGIRKGLSEEERLANAVRNAAKYCDPEKAGYPAMYRRVHAAKIAEMVSIFRSLTASRAGEIIHEYRDRHGILGDEAWLPDPE